MNIHKKKIHCAQEMKEGSENGDERLNYDTSGDEKYFLSNSTCGYMKFFLSHLFRVSKMEKNCDFSNNMSQFIDVVKQKADK